MKYTTLFFNSALFLTISPTICQIKSLPLHFSHFKKFYSSFLLDKKLLRYKLWPFKQSYLATMIPKVLQYGYETFQNVAPVLHSVICSEMNTASITNKRLL